MQMSGEAPQHVRQNRPHDVIAEFHAIPARRGLFGFARAVLHISLALEDGRVEQPMRKKQSPSSSDDGPAEGRCVDLYTAGGRDRSPLGTPAPIRVVDRRHRFSDAAKEWADLLLHVRWRS